MRIGSKEIKINLRLPFAAVYAIVVAVVVALCVYRWALVLKPVKLASTLVIETSVPLRHIVAYLESNGSQRAVIPVEPFGGIPDVQITALGSHSAQAQGNEVWLLSIDPPAASVNNGQWIQRPHPLADAGKAWMAFNRAVLKFHPAGPFLQLRFLQHGWSGKVRIGVPGGNSQEIDLYSAGHESKTVEYSTYTPESTDTGYRYRFSLQVPVVHGSGDRVQIVSWPPLNHNATLMTENTYAEAVGADTFELASRWWSARTAGLIASGIAVVLITTVLTLVLPS